MGKLAKPQRSRKHKKIKAIDPFYTGPRTADRKAAFMNQPPKKNDEDVISNRMRELIELKKQTKSGMTKSKKRKKRLLENQDNKKMEKGMTRPLKPVPTFKQRIGETDTEFMRRIHEETQTVVNIAKLEEKFDVDIYETESGEYRMTKRKPDVFAEEKVKKKKKLLKKQEKAKKIKEDKLQDQIEEFKHLHDDVLFGEVAQAPPLLTAKPRKAKESKTNKPGTKSLILEDMLQHKKEAPKSSTERNAGETVKHKYMSIAERRILEMEREKAVALYRLLKKKKRMQTMN